MPLSFRRVTDLLTGTPRVPVSRVALLLQRDPHTIARARMRGEHARRPPEGWEQALAPLALEHAKELEEWAAQLRLLAEVLADPKNSQGSMRPHPAKDGRI